MISEKNIMALLPYFYFFRPLVPVGVLGRNKFLSAVSLMAWVIHSGVFLGVRRGYAVPPAKIFGLVAYPQLSSENIV